jgi:phospholipase C
MASLNVIDHFVVLMLENRSFDSMLGTLYPAGKGFRGLTGAESNSTGAGADVKVWSDNPTDLDNESMSIPDPDPGELFTDMNTQIFKSAQVSSPYPAAPMSGFVRDYEPVAAAAGKPAKGVMHYYLPEQVPVLSGLAQAYAVSDCWHASAPCQTWPNRLFLHTGTAGGRENNDPTRVPYEMPTIFGRFDAAGMNNGWKIYFHDMPQAFTLKELWKRADRFRFFEEFLDDAAHGTLPTYSFIEPRYFADMRLPNDQHPPHNVTLGEQLISAVYKAVRNGPLWQKTLLIITYDEHGGCYDHVPPPLAEPPSTPLPGQAFAFDRYGVRVPAVLVSPYIRSNTVLRPNGDIPFDHTSVMATLRARFPALGGPLTRRDRLAPDVADVLNLNAPRANADCPESIEPNPYATTPGDMVQAQTLPLNGMQRGLLHMAAQLPLSAKVTGSSIDVHAQMLLANPQLGAAKFVQVCSEIERDPLQAISMARQRLLQSIGGK